MGNGKSPTGKYGRLRLHRRPPPLHQITEPSAKKNKPVTLYTCPSLKAPLTSYYTSSKNGRWRSPPSPLSPSPTNTWHTCANGKRKISHWQIWPPSSPSPPASSSSNHRAFCH